MRFFRQKCLKKRMDIACFALRFTAPRRNLFILRVTVSKGQAVIYLSPARTLLKILAALLVSALAGCASTHYPINAPLARPLGERAYVLGNLAAPANNSDQIFVSLSFSGGGLRAAALAYGVMEALAQTRIEWQGQEKRLLDEVDIIAGVSGGSLPALYYGLHGDGLFTDLPEKLLYADLQGDIWGRLLNPLNLWRLTSKRYGRIELVAQAYDKHLFRGATFNDLRRERPFIVVSASELSLGTRFEFTQDDFDLLCSDLNQLPLARAAAASSALPFVFSPLTLWNHQEKCPVDVFSIKDSSALTLYYAQRGAWVKSPTVHLLDGGLTDNMGVRGAIDFARSYRRSPDELRSMPQFKDIQHVIFIVVNAETAPVLKEDASADVPGPFRTIQAFVDIPINRYSAETREQLRTTLTRLQDDVRAAAAARKDNTFNPQVQFHFIEVSLQPESADPRLFDLPLISVPTTLHLDRATVDKIRAYGHRTLLASPDFKRVLEEIKQGAR
jgi:NTE family protein